MKNRSSELPVHSISHIFFSLQTALPNSSCPHRRAALCYNNQASRSLFNNFSILTVLNTDTKDRSYTKKPSFYVTLNYKISSWLLSFPLVLKSAPAWIRLPRLIEKWLLQGSELSSLQNSEI